MQGEWGVPFSHFGPSLPITHVALTCSQPTPGYFTDDETIDFLLQIPNGVGMKKVKPGDEDQSEHISRMNLVSRPVLGIMKNRKNLTTQSKISKCSRMGKMNSHSANIYSSSNFSRCPTPCVAVPCGISSVQVLSEVSCWGKAGINKCTTSVYILRFQRSWANGGDGLSWRTS